MDPNTDPNDPKWMFWRRRRYVVAILGFFGLVTCFCLRINMSIAIVAMTKPANNETKPEFDWDSKLQGHILSSFFYGYITTQVGGGYLAAKIGGVKVLGIGIGVTAFLTILTPILVNIHVGLLIAIRVLEGIFEGVSYPSMHQVLSKWAPINERSRLSTIVFSGAFLGTVISLPISALLAEHLNWPSIFYFFGILGIIWSMIWLYCIEDDPKDDRRISKSELFLIQGANKDEEKIRKVTSVPWLSLLTSPPVWAIIIAHSAENWGFYTLVIQLPKFMDDVFKNDLSTTGLFSALPYVLLTIFMPLSGLFADWFITKGILSRTRVRKLFNCSAFLLQASFLLGVAFFDSFTACVACLILAIGSESLAWSGFSVNHLDVAPQYAGILMGLSNGIGTIPGIISPTLTGYIVTTQSKNEWQIVFYISAAVYLFGGIFYGLLASAELQIWAKDDPKDKKCKFDA